MLPNVWSVLSQCNTRLGLLHLLFDIDFRAQTNKTRFFYALCSDKTWDFDQSELAQGTIYIINAEKQRGMLAEHEKNSYDHEP